MTQIKAVVFDIGKVLIEWPPERFYDSKIDSNRRHELFTNGVPPNIEAATKRGWNTHLFGGAIGWAKTLVHHNVLTQTEACL